MPEYEFRPLGHSAPEIAAVSGLLRGVFPHAAHLTPAYLRWLYVDNPEGRALGFNAYHEGELVGHCAGQPFAARVEGEALRGILLVNAAVHPRHVRRNITRRTTDPMFEDAAGQGVSFAVAVGNARSTLPLLTRFAMLRPLHARIGFGLPRRRERGVAPGYERLWTEESLRWRLANPERAYSVRTGNGRTAVTSGSGRPGIGAVLYDGDERWPLPDAGGAPPGPLKAWLGLDPAVDWARSPFLPIPGPLKPSPLNLMFKDLSGGGLHPDPARVVFRGLDFDAY